MIGLFRKGCVWSLIIVLLTSGFIVFHTDRSVGTLDDDIVKSIDLGVNWLASRQNEDGSWGTNNYLALTGLVLTKLQEYAWEHDKSPFDDNYAYKNNVVNGWKFLFGSNETGPFNLVKHSMYVQLHGNKIDDPDTRKNGYGLYFYSSTSSYSCYNTGICLMALESTGMPDRPNDGGLDLDGDNKVDTLFEITQDIVDWVAYAQGDYNSGEGGWGYNYQNNSGGSADNSNSGYIVLGLEAGEEFGCVVPDWVRDRLNVWISNIQNPVDNDVSGNDGGGYYNVGSISTSILRTGNLLFEMRFYGDNLTNPRFQAAIDYIERHWKDQNLNPGWGYQSNPADYQAMFCVMKGFEYSGINYIDLDDDGIREHDWFKEYAAVLVTQQNVNGSWPACSHGDYMMILSTTWALLTLEKIIPPDKPPEPVPGSPVADAGGPYFGFEGDPITFDASKSFSPDQNELEYRWDFDGDGDWDTGKKWLSSPKIDHVFGDDWVGIANLEVRNKDYNFTKTVRDTAVVIIRNIAPSIEAVQDITISVNTTVNLAAIVTDPGSDDIYLEWVWGFAWAGVNYTVYLNEGSYPDPYPSTDLNPRIVTDSAGILFNTSGTFKVITIATDDDGAVSYCNISITVIDSKIYVPPNTPPIAGILGIPWTGYAPLNVSFKSVGIDADGTVIFFFWDFGDNGTAAKILDPPSNGSSHKLYHTFMKPGTYYVNFTIMDDDGATNTEIIVIYVKEKPVPPIYRYQLLGYVFESESTIRIPNVNISTGSGFVLSEDNGFYSIILPAGIYKFDISKDGYEPSTKTINLTSNSTENFYLTPLKVVVPPKVEEEADYSWFFLVVLMLIMGMILTIIIIKNRSTLKDKIPPEKPTVVKPAASTSTIKTTPGVGPTIPTTIRKIKRSAVPQQQKDTAPKPVLEKVQPPAQTPVPKPTVIAPGETLPAQSQSMNVIDKLPVAKKM